MLSLWAIPFLTMLHRANSELKVVSIVSFANQNKNKAKVFKTLQLKCNVCHIKKNKRKIFTIDNMNGFASEINTQVFIKKRMPKGINIKLTQKEYQLLYIWLEGLK